MKVVEDAFYRAQLIFMKKGLQRVKFFAGP
jgi:hypothetical protein